MATTEERLARIEEGYSHLATKADVYSLANYITTVNGKVDSLNTYAKWGIGVSLVLHLLILGKLFDLIPI